MEKIKEFARIEELHRKIILLLSNGPRIQKEIIENLGLDHTSSRDKNCISRAIKDLEDIQIIKRQLPDKGQGKLCKLNEDIEVFKKLIKVFIDTSEGSIFHKSTYCEKMITPPLLRDIEKLWKIDFNIFRNKAIETELKDPHFFTENDVLKILKESPTALKNALDNPNNVIDRGQFETMLISSLILDMTTGQCRNFDDCCFKTKMSIKIYGPKKSELFLKEYDLSLEPLLCKIPIETIPELVKKLPSIWVCPNCGNEMMNHTLVCSRCDQITPLGEMYFK